MPGEEVGDSLDAAAQFAARGMGTVLTSLGERVTSVHEAMVVRDHYLETLSCVHQRGLPSQISVKLTHLGLDADGEACTQNVMSLAERAKAIGTFVWIDMEESHYTDATLALFRRVRGEHSNVGLCLQAYLHRTAADIESLSPLRPAIRLVKGAYNESPSIALSARSEVDTRFLMFGERLIRQAADNGATVAFGTHDMRLVARLRESAARMGAPESSYEIHMLYGIRASDQAALAADGCVVRVLISYGTAWFPWYMRRLAERPANVWFVLRNLVG